MSRLQNSIRRVRRLARLDEPAPVRPAATPQPVAVATPVASPPIERAVPAAPAPTTAAPIEPAPALPARGLQADPGLLSRLNAHEAQGSYLVLGQAARSNDMPAVRRLSTEIHDRLSANGPAALSRMTSERHPSLEFTESLGSLMSVTNPFGVEPESDDSAPPETGTIINPANFAPVPPAMVSRARSADSLAMSAEQHGRQRALIEGPSPAGSPVRRMPESSERANAVVSPVQRTPAGRVRSRVSEGTLESFATMSDAPPAAEMPLASPAASTSEPSAPVARTLSESSRIEEMIAAAESSSTATAAAPSTEVARTLSTSVASPPLASSPGPNSGHAASSPATDSVHPAPSPATDSTPSAAPADSRTPAAPAASRSSSDEGGLSSGANAAQEPTSGSNIAFVEPAIARSMEPEVPVADPPSPPRAAARAATGEAAAPGVERRGDSDLPTVPAALAQRAPAESAVADVDVAAGQVVRDSSSEADRLATVLRQAETVSPTSAVPTAAAAASPASSSSAPGREPASLPVVARQTSETVRATGDSQTSADDSQAATVTGDPGPPLTTASPREPASSDESAPASPAGLIVARMVEPDAEPVDPGRSPHELVPPGGDSGLSGADSPAIARASAIAPVSTADSPPEMPVVATASPVTRDEQPGSTAPATEPPSISRAIAAAESVSSPSPVSVRDEGVESPTATGTTGGSVSAAAAPSPSGLGDHASLDAPATIAVPRVPVVARSFDPATSGERADAALPVAARQIGAPPVPATASVATGDVLRPAVVLRQRESPATFTRTATGTPGSMGRGTAAREAAGHGSASASQGAVIPGPDSSAPPPQLPMAASPPNSPLDDAAGGQGPLARTIAEAGSTAPGNSYDTLPEMVDAPQGSAIAASAAFPGPDSEAAGLSTIARAAAVEPSSPGVSRSFEPQTDGPVVPGSRGSLLAPGGPAGTPNAFATLAHTTGGPARAIIGSQRANATSVPGSNPVVTRSSAPIPRTVAREVQRAAAGPGMAAARSSTSLPEMPALSSMSRQGALPELSQPFANGPSAGGTESVIARMISSAERQAGGGVAASQSAGPWSSSAASSQARTELPPAVRRMPPAPDDGGSGDDLVSQGSPATPAQPPPAATADPSAEGAAAATSDADVDKLADKVWTIIRHKLHIERERQRGF